MKEVNEELVKTNEKVSEAKKEVEEKEHQLSVMKEELASETLKLEETLKENEKRFQVELETESKKRSEAESIRIIHEAAERIGDRDDAVESTWRSTTTVIRYTSE